MSEHGDAGPPSVHLCGSGGRPPCTFCDDLVAGDGVRQLNGAARDGPVRGGEVVVDRLAAAAVDGGWSG